MTVMSQGNGPTNRNELADQGDIGSARRKLASAVRDVLAEVLTKGT